MSTRQDQLESMAADVRSRFTLDAFVRRAVAEQINSQWALSLRAEQADRSDRMETMMSTSDFNFARRYLLSEVERSKVREALAAIPTNIRGDLEVQQTRLRSEVYRHLGAEQRRRCAEIRCMIADAIEALDELEFYDCRRLLVDADHAIGFMLDQSVNADRIGRRKLADDARLRQQMALVGQHLRADAKALSGVVA